MEFARRTQTLFQSTRWSLLRRLGGEEADEQAEALDELSRIYWPAIYGFLRRKGYSREDAAEHTQAFFQEVVLGRGLFRRVDSGRGRLRSLILVSLRNHLADGERSRRRRRRPLSLDERTAREDELLRQNEHLPAEEAFNRRCALAVIEESLRRCEQHFRGLGKARHWLLFECRVLLPARTGRPAPVYEELAIEHGLGKPSEAASAVDVVRRRLRLILRQVAHEHGTDGSVEQLLQDCGPSGAA